MTLEEREIVERAIKIVENCAGFDDETSSAGESFLVIKKTIREQEQEIAALKSRLKPVEDAYDRTKSQEKRIVDIFEADNGERFFVGLAYDLWQDIKAAGKEK